MIEILRQVARLFVPVTRPLAGTRWFRLWAIVEHDGRRSGRRYRTTVVARRVEDGFIIPMPFGPDTQWAKNVIAAGGCSIRWAGGTYATVAPQTIDLATAAAAFSGLQRRILEAFRADRYMRVTTIDVDAPGG